MQAKAGPARQRRATAETVLLLNGSLHVPSHAACGSGGQGAGRPADGLRQSALETDSSAAAVDGDAVLARVSRHILPLFFSLALLNSIDRGAGIILISKWTVCCHISHCAGAWLCTLCIHTRASAP